MQSEKQLQTICVAWFRDTYKDYLIYSSLNGVKLTGGSKYAILVEEIRLGMLKGVSDLLVCLPNGVTLNIEMKTLTGKQSKDQVAIEKTLKSLGHHYYLVREFKEFKRVINKHI